ncbi:uncharacterized protein LOC135835200 [Planococcus citri]|uniref:uncharacterized protein LOC135835200 n=1 Tax=Planococcus citri TaxID=170843 RepID=UPI0031F979BE
MHYENYKSQSKVNAYLLNLNTAMDVKIVHFLTVLFIFYTVTSSDTSQIKNIKENLDEIDTENGFYEYRNATIPSEVDNVVTRGAKMDIFVKYHKVRLSMQLYDDMYEVIQLKGNTSRQIYKMMYNIKILLHSISKSLAKENNQETLDDLLLSLENEGLIEELKKSLNQLKNLKSKLYAISKDITGSSADDGALNALSQFSHDDSKEMSWNEDVNDEEPLLKLDIDQECDELEKLRRFSLMVQDELKEMPRSNNGISEDNMQSESNSRNPLPESATVPLWLLHERDIEEIQLRYTMWTTVFKQTDKETVNILKKEATKRGYPIALFCKMLAEYYNFTTKLLECVSQEDSECEKMVMKIMKHQHLQDMVHILAAIGLIDNQQVGVLTGDN